MPCQLNSHPQKCPSASIVVSASLIQLLCIWEKNERYVMMGFFLFCFSHAAPSVDLLQIKSITFWSFLIFFALVLTKSYMYSLLFPPSCAVCAVMFVIQHAACTLSIQMPLFNIYYSESARCSTCHLFHASIEFNCIFIPCFFASFYQCDVLFCNSNGPVFLQGSLKFHVFIL